jgi:hypothetical protein
MSQLGRIGGQVLTDNLLRAGVDLAFENNLLYLDVTNQRIGINKSVPVYDLDVDSEIGTNNLTVLTQLSVDNIVVNSPNTFTTSVGGIDIFIAGSDIYHARLITSNLEINDNYISSYSNSNITLDPSGSGTVEFLANTNIAGDLTVGTALAPRNINISGDLSKQGSLILGDQIIDTVTINTDFSQSIIPGDDLVWSIGENTGDSSPRRWAELHSPDWTNITTGAWPGSGLLPQSMIVSDQTSLDGINNKISAIQSNEDIRLLPNTGITYIERTKWQDSDITNLLNTPLTLSSTGIGYTQFTGTDAMIIPAGNNSQRQLTPEIGETRWNTELGYLECFDGTVWEVSTGGGDEVTTTIMEELSTVYIIVFG